MTSGFALLLRLAVGNDLKVLTELDTTMRTWPLQEARTHLRDVIDGAIQQGPQRITRHGKDAVIVVSELEWARRNEAAPSFGALLTDVPFTRRDRPPRKPSAVIRRALFE